LGILKRILKRILEKFGKKIEKAWVWRILEFGKNYKLENKNWQINEIINKIRQFGTI